MRREVVWITLGASIAEATQLMLDISIGDIGPQLRIQPELLRGTL